jgi:hypothetical protein
MPRIKIGQKKTIVQHYGKKKKQGVFRIVEEKKKNGL